MIYFGTLHLENSVPDKYHDHLHDGLGFLTQHMSLTNEYELALQSVNPSVAMPYWDFTQDMVIIRDKAKANKRAVDYQDLWELDLWQDDFFGTSDTHLHTVTKGRWAYTRVPKISRETEVANPYGYMRAPWNLDVSPYITRFHKSCGDNMGSKGDYETNQWPTCAIHHYAVSSIDSWAYFTGYMAIDAHGGVHRLIGGAGGDCDNWGEMLDLLGPEKVSNLREYATFLGRFVWRESTCTMPSSEKCDGSTKNKKAGDNECKLHCVGCTNDKFTEDELTTYAGYFHSFDDASKFQVAEMTRKVFCDSKIVVGEQIEANSAIDATFWPIHPTLERLLHYKQMVNPLTNFEWDGNLYSSLWAEGCYWATWFGGDTTCTGHREESPTVGVVSPPPLPSTFCSV